MKIFQDNLLNLKNIVIILGFFDGIHLGHREVISSAIKYAKEHNAKTLLYTFSCSPAEFFGEKTEYIYSRNYNYKLIENLGVDFLIENNFSNLINIKREDFLFKLIENYSPIAIFTGFNYTFGKKREGDVNYLKNKASFLGFDYYSIEPIKIDKKTVSSTMIKTFLADGNILEANKCLTVPFVLSNKVIKGKQLAVSLGYPTANMIYPNKIIKLPFGVYKAKYKTYNAILNWGVKPTFKNTQEPILELHIINFNENLYDKQVEFEILEKIRDEKKFVSINELKKQIKKDIFECSK